MELVENMTFRSDDLSSHKDNQDTGKSYLLSQNINQFRQSQKSKEY